MRRLRKYLAPLATDTTSALELPPIRMGLLTKLNALTVGMILATAVAMTGFSVWQQQRVGANELKAQGSTVLEMLTELSEYGLYTNDRAYLESVLNSVNAEGDIAYVLVEDAQHRTIVERRIAESLQDVALPELPAAQPASDGAIGAADRTILGRRYIELLAAVGSGRSAAAFAEGTRERPPPAVRAAAGTAPIGFIRVGMTFERQQAQLRTMLIGFASVIGLLVVLAIGATLFLTRRLVAPMRRLMRAARAVGSGKLDVYVPARSSDELGLLTHTFNHMTQRLAESQAEVATYQRTLEDKVAQRTKELEIATAHAYKLAQHDILTGLPNRSLLNQRLKQILAQAQRDSTHVACLFLDFDHFKRINDTLGHDSGDQLLQSVAQRLTNAVRESDTVGAPRRRRVRADPAGPRPGERHVRDDVGTLARARVVPRAVPDLRPDADPDLLDRRIDVPARRDRPGLADQAGRHRDVRGEGRRSQRIPLLHGGHEHARAAAPAARDRHAARPHGRRVLPRIPAADRDAHRARLRRRGAVPLARPRARHHRASRIHTGRRGVRDDPGARRARAARQLPADDGSGTAHGMMLRLSVNLSVQQLQHDSWLSIVEEALTASGLPPQYLDLEITESVIITHPEKAVATLVKLKQRGVSITVDDFGTGYSSLSYLTRLPIQAVKIDQRFVHGLEQNRNDEAVTQAIIALSHSLGLRVIAEGVETAAQLEFLKRHGCDEAQGYLISRPLEVPALRDWWRQQETENRIVGRQGDMWQSDRAEHKV